MKLKIVGSIELIDFGAEFKPDFMVPFIKGISFTKTSGLKYSKKENAESFLQDIVRIPKETSDKKVKIWWFESLKRRVSYFMLSDEGMVTNLLIVIIHLLIIIGTPLLILLAVAWSLIQIGTINQDIYATVFTFNDIFNSSSYNFWLDHIAGKVYFYIIAGF